MTREDARQLQRQLRQQYPQDNVDVTRVFGGVEVAAGNGHGWLFLRTTDDSPLLRLLGADLATHEDLRRSARPARQPGRDPPSRRHGRHSGSIIPSVIQVMRIICSQPAATWYR